MINLGSNINAYTCWTGGVRLTNLFINGQAGKASAIKNDGGFDDHLARCYGHYWQDDLPRISDREIEWCCVWLR